MSTTRTEVFSKIQRMVAEQLDVEAAQVREGSSFVDDLGADSLSLVELVMAFEEGFGITIPDAASERLRTVGDAVSYVLDHAAASSGQSALSP